VDLDDWFLKRGLPHLIDDYSARTDVWTRAIPALVAFYVLGSLNALNADWTLGENVAALAGALALVVITWAVANRLRGRPAFSYPTELGPGELAVFLLVPPLIPLIFGQQWRSALAAFVAGLVVLGAIYVVTSYGLVSMTRWAAGRVAAQIGSLGPLASRALPTLLLIVIVLFLTAEVWQAMATLDGLPYPMVLGLIFTLGTSFVVARLPGELSDLTHFASWEEVHQLAARTPCDHTAGGAGEPTLVLTRRQWLNVALVALFSQGVIITVVVLAAFAFFVLLGFLAIPAETIAAWTTAEANVLLGPVHLTGRELVVTEELLRLSGFLAAFSGLTFTVSLVTDASYREEFREEVVGELRESLAAKLLSRITDRRGP
jgi:hypothetical protein